MCLIRGHYWRKFLRKCHRGSISTMPMLIRPLELTLPDCDTFIPEFGLCLPPELQLNFDTDSSPTSARQDFDFSANLSDALQTPLTGRSHEFSLPGYDMSVGNDYNDS